jgi:hypothetical protein
VNVAFAVLSKGRPQNVAKMREHLTEIPAVWYVLESEEAEYKAAGARTRICPPGVVPAANAALEDAFARGSAVVIMSDDLKRIKRLRAGTQGMGRDGGKADIISLQEAIGEMVLVLEEYNLKLAGTQPTGNVGWMKHKVNTRAFIVFDLILVYPSHLRFDPNLRTKVDYDFTLQNWEAFGGAARLEYLAAEVDHYTNDGGIVSIRTDEMEQETIAYLQEKWPGMLRLNPKRKNEVLLVKSR